MASGRLKGAIFAMACIFCAVVWAEIFQLLAQLLRPPAGG
jgi:hypothetical protein